MGVVTVIDEYFFKKGRGKDIDNDSCGEGEFSVRVSNADTNELLYTEFIEEIYE